MVMTQVLHKPPGPRTIPADMPPRANRRGEETRAGILRELRRRERAGDLPPTLGELARMLDLRQPTISHHVAILIEDGCVAWEQTSAYSKVLRLLPHA